MYEPKTVFQRPDEYWGFLTAADDSRFEGQHFDRKEAGHPEPNGRVSDGQLKGLRQHIAECCSAFANTNKSGGLLVIGVSGTGEVLGVDHLAEKQMNSLTNINELLRNQSCQVRQIYQEIGPGIRKKLCLIYTPYTERAICETPGRSPDAWRRQGAQNILLNDAQREQLRRDKGIVDFELTYCCPYDPLDVDRGVLEEFRKVYLSGASREFTDEDILYQAGALIKDGTRYAFTNAGMLFFASNPQRVLTWSYVRLLRFAAFVEHQHGRKLPTFERNFGGPITKQIRDMRIFFKDSGFFKTYPKRNVDGGFSDEPEFPYVAVDEAIVNAVAHRDYGMSLPIECESYRDALVVRNSGRVLQRDRDVPDEFSLDTMTLVSTPRNPKLIEWLKLMKDERGVLFVRALSEGTKLMHKEMADWHLPPPAYRVSESQTAVTLYNNSVEREAALQSAMEAPASEFTNLFPLSLQQGDRRNVGSENCDFRRQDLMAALRDALLANGWYIDVFKYSKLVAHPKRSVIPLPKVVQAIVRLYPAYSFQLREYWGRFYLCIDYTLEVKNVQTLQALAANFKPSEFVGKTAVVQWNGWQRGRIEAADHEWTNVYIFDFDQVVQVPSNRAIPSLPKVMLGELLNQQSSGFDLHRAIKQHSLALEPNAARIRADKTLSAVSNLTRSVFPIRTNGITVIIDPRPSGLARNARSQNALAVHTLPEPTVEFNHQRESADIRDGITKFGAYQNSPKNIELVPICTPALRDKMAALIERLKVGKYKYRGAERTFSARFEYSSIVTVSSVEQTPDECTRLLSEHPDWIGNPKLDRIFLVYTPEEGYAADDEQSPYYRTKRILLESGIPCQMVDTPTIVNPDWKDLNLALNITAKCNVTPWVLPDAIPDADFFVGLSYTQSRYRGAERLMGFANVFNKYGRWEFYSSNIDAFPYEERAARFQKLVKETLERLMMSETPSIYFHYSAKFSKEDREAILASARSIRPFGTYSFVWINTHHGVRLYDGRAETDGSLSRGSYVTSAENQVYLSTTGYNHFRKVLGTPEMLEVTIRTERPEGMPHASPDLRALALQVLNLTKLNWASTDSLCGEPITIKFAGDIAYLTDAFIRQGHAFRLHPVLENTPWFI